MWIGNKDRHGYGRLHVPGKGMQRAHREAYIRTYGVELGDDEIDHLCRVPGCVNPAHLRAVPAGFNVAQGLVTRNANWIARTHCKRGHAYAGQARHGTHRCKECLRATWSRAGKKYYRKKMAEKTTRMRG